MKYLWLTLLLAACATLGTTTDDDKLTIADTSDSLIQDVKFASQTGNAKYTYKDQSFQAQWIACSTDDAKATVLAMHRDRRGYDPKTFCQGWIAQAFLSEGMNVITVNRPGFAGSTGVADFAGAQSMAAITAGVEAAKGKGASSPTGIWGYSSGATAASLFSREIDGLKYLILGGGVYDLDETMNVTKDSYLKKEIKAIYKTGGDLALEDRSIAYDVEGLPKRIVLYHGKQDKAVPTSQANTFRDTLVSSEYKASIQVIDGVSHQIPVGTHQKIIKVLARSVR